MPTRTLSVRNRKGTLSAIYSNWEQVRISGSATTSSLQRVRACGSFFIPLIIGAFGLALLKVRYFRLWKNVLRFLLATVIISAILGYFAGQSTFIGAGPGGEFGYMIAHRLNEMMGKVGNRSGAACYHRCRT
ncbi:MAG: hypothetical protein U5L72_12840 [Bacteroidales bacterium]|nr:hypothetical protein [Bacteroidales bacterium]